MKSAMFSLTLFFYFSFIFATTAAAQVFRSLIRLGGLKSPDRQRLRDVTVSGYDGDSIIVRASKKETTAIRWKLKIAAPLIA